MNQHAREEVETSAFATSKSPRVRLLFAATSCACALALLAGCVAEAETAKDSNDRETIEFSEEVRDVESETSAAEGTDAQGSASESHETGGTDAGDGQDGSASTSDAQAGGSPSGSDAAAANSSASAADPGATAGSDTAAAPNSATQADLAARDADFAVDPDRQTEWNFEGNGRKTVYLTIDDGPSELTSQVLDILDKYDCKATFFVVGLNPDYYPMIKEAYDRGHTIGLHSYTHDYASVYSSEDAYFADLDAIGQVVKDQIGYVPCFVRFPGGASNAISAEYCSGIMSTLVNSVPARGYQFYDWNMSVGDGSEHTTDEIIGYGTEPTELTNIVLLCHDSATKQSTVDALPAIIEHYQSLGYTFEAIDRESFVPHHGVSN